ncbi:hypothetical protein D3C87_1437240 [compost metagenome]
MTFYCADHVSISPNAGWFFGGKEALVLYSYFDAYGFGSKTSYSVLIRGQGACSWVEGGDMKLLKASDHDLYEKWCAEFPPSKPDPVYAIPWIEDPAIKALRIDLYECTERPALILKPFEPKNAIEYAWIPQTIGDQIWVVYRFSNAADAEAWATSLPTQLAGWLDDKVKGAAQKYGFKTYQP